jgi:lipopolysaccharide export LptBFGC system permease protein LptF
MPLNSIIPAHLMTAFEEKKQAYIQELFDKATEIDLKNNLYHRYYLNQYQINSFDQGVNLIKKVNPIKEEDSYNNDFNDLLENFLKDHVNSLKQMKALLSGVTKRNLATILMIIYRQVPEKIELFKQALSQDQISSIEETVQRLKRDEFLNTDFNLQ